MRKQGESTGCTNQRMDGEGFSEMRENVDHAKQVSTTAGTQSRLSRMAISSRGLAHELTAE